MGAAFARHLPELERLQAAAMRTPVRRKRAAEGTRLLPMVYRWWSMNVARLAGTCNYSDARTVEFRWDHAAGAYPMLLQVQLYRQLVRTALHAPDQAWGADDLIPPGAAYALMMPMHNLSMYRTAESGVSKAEVTRFLDLLTFPPKMRRLYDEYLEGL